MISHVPCLWQCFRIHKEVFQGGWDSQGKGGRGALWTQGLPGRPPRRRVSESLHPCFDYGIIFAYMSIGGVGGMFSSLLKYYLTRGKLGSFGFQDFPNSGFYKNQQLSGISMACFGKLGSFPRSDFQCRKPLSPKEVSLAGSSFGKSLRVRDHFQFPVPPLHPPPLTPM